jgi:hypothetical protein
MKAQFTSLKAIKTNHYVAQSEPLATPNDVLKTQATTLQVTSNTTNVNNNEILKLSKELGLKNTLLTTEKNNHKDMTSLLEQTQAANVFLKKENQELHKVINKRKEDINLISQAENLEHSQSLHRINVLEKLLAERDGQIKGLQESLQLIMSHNPLSLNMSNLNIEESQIQATSTPIDTVESILMGQSNQNNSEQHVDISYGEPILINNEPLLLGGAQPQLMGNSSSDFSIIHY